MIKILLGGSPCTHWSIAQKNNRETEPEGLGWELFNNYLIAKKKFNPDYFLYENNKSAAQPIKDQISRELGVDLMYINSALVSAQNRQRFYAFNWEVDQPEDRGILLRDILETGVGDQRQRDKSRTITAGYTACSQRDLRMDIETDGFMGKQGAMEPVGVGWRGRKGEDGKWHKIYESNGEPKANCLTSATTDSMVAEPVRVPEYGSEDKARPLGAHYPNNCGGFEHRMFSDNPNKQQVDMIADPVCMRYERSPEAKRLRKQYEAGEIKHGFRELSELHPRTDGKTNCLSTVTKDNPVCEPAYYPYAEPVEWDADGKPIKAVSAADGKSYIVYEVKDGVITIKDKQYPIKLVDGFYIIRKLTPVECERLQTLPDGYTRAVSDAQRYKGLGNGWTAEVIIHILNGILKDVPRDEEIVVLSMYDGIGTGRYCLDAMGFTNVTYYAYEIDKFAKQIAMSNYPDIIQCGDAFDIRHPDWTIGY